MVTVQQDVQGQVQSTVIQHWWRYTHREHRLTLRLLREKPENLAHLNSLPIILRSIDKKHTETLRSRYPNAVRELRSFMLSAERNFIECLQSIHNEDMTEAERHYNNAKNDLSLMQYIFMELGIESHI